MASTCGLPNAGAPVTILRDVIWPPPRSSTKHPSYQQWSSSNPGVYSSTASTSWGRPLAARTPPPPRFRVVRRLHALSIASFLLLPYPRDAARGTIPDDKAVLSSSVESPLPARIAIRLLYIDSVSSRARPRFSNAPGAQTRQTRGLLCLRVVIRRAMTALAWSEPPVSDTMASKDRAFHIPGMKPSHTTPVDGEATVPAKTRSARESPGRRWR